MMRRILLLIISMFLFINLSALVIESGSFKNFLYGEEPNSAYDDFVSHIAEGIADVDYNLYAPFDPQTNGFGDFDVPNTTELNEWSTITQEFAAGNYDQAETLINNGGYPYDVVSFTDNDTGAIYYMLREHLNMSYVDDNFDNDPDDDVTGSFDKGWGLFIYNPQATNPVIVTVPHPTDDFCTAIIGYECFRKWDGMFLLINGAGREVTWTNQGYYYNSKSLSDPTRNQNTVYQKAYISFCNKIRTQFGVREFSAQMHSYDWGTRHPGYANNQISGGKYEEILGLPSFDLSNSHYDLVNLSDEVIFPANTIGVHREVTLNEYYTFHNTVYDRYFYKDNGDSILVNTDQDLPGYKDNRQMQYTNDSSFNTWDAYDNFWHVEMDELPNQYDQTENNLKWFYGWDPVQQKYIKEDIFTHTLEFYSYWIDKMAESLTYTFAMNDNMIPPTPQNLTVHTESYNYISLEWDHVRNFDFDTYEVLYATEPIGTDNFSIFDRDNSSRLADMRNGLIDVTGLSNGQQYYFKVRARDKNGNISGESNEVVAVTGCSKIRSVKALGRDGLVELSWNAQYENNVQGYRIYRSTDNENYTQLVDWNSYGGLTALNSNNTNYSYNDDTVMNNTTYYYKIAAINNSDEEFIHNYSVSVQPYDFFKLHVANQADTYTSDIYFGINRDATDGHDDDYDVNKSSSVSGNYVWAGFWEEDWWNGTNYGVTMEQNIQGLFDTTTDYKSYRLRIKSNQTNQNLTISLHEMLPSRSTEKIWIYDEGNQNWTDLMNGDYTFQVSNTNYRYMRIYYGNLNPYFEIDDRQNHIFQGGMVADFYWESNLSFLIDHIELSLQNDTDSVFVSDTVSSSYEFYFWEYVPDNIEYHNLKLVVDGIAMDGERVRAVSPYILGIVPSTTTIEREAGWHTVSSPFISDVMPATDVFGNNAILWEYNSSNVLVEVTDFEYGEAYWAFVSNDNTANISEETQATSDEFDLNYGWNFIVNPFPTEISLENCMFEINNVWFSSAEALNELNLNPNMVVYREGMYQQVNSILPYEAFFLFCTTDNTANPNIRIYPYRDALPMEQPLTSTWNLKLFADNGIDKSMIEVGSAYETTEDYDLEYDIPSLPNKPITEHLDFNLYHSVITEPDYPFEFMMKELTVPFVADVDTSFVWQYILRLGSTDAIQFYPDFSQFNMDYTVKISINGDDYFITDENGFTYQPSSTRDIFGTITVYNYTVGNEETPQVASKFSVYPNPFNPDTNIAFNVKKAGKVELSLYNIRGQKVKTLIKDELTPGNHTITWDGTDSNGKGVASGVYFARLKQRDEKARVKKMMLMK